MKYPRVVLTNSIETVFVDIDGTLHSAQGVNTQLIEKLRQFNDQGKELVLWSSRGREYAQQFAGAHGISDLFVAIVGKPTAIIDDRGWQWAARFVPAFHPGAVAIADDAGDSKPDN